MHTMARRNSPNNKNQPQTSVFLPIILFILRVFIGIGNAVRWLGKSLILAPYKTYRIIVSSIQTLATSPIFTTPFRQVQIKQTKRTKKSTAQLSTIHKSIKNSITTLLQRLRISFSSMQTILTQMFARLPRKRITPTKHTTISPLTTKKQWKLPHLHVPSFSFLRFPAKIHTDSAQPTFSYSTIEKGKFFVAGIAVTIVFFFAPYMTFVWLKALPNPQLLSRRDLQVTTKIFDRHGTLLYEIYAEQNRTPLALADIPRHVKEATIAIEDQDFYSHNGISPRGILRAMRETFFNNQIQGGSTITQQLIKSALLSPDVKITRKIKEVILAFWAERLYTKNQILEMYLNQVPYGGTAWGVEAASQTYFGKSATTLNLAEAALLAGLPQAPTQYSPFGSHPEKAYERQKEVLRRMVEDHYITTQEAEIAINTPIRFVQPHTAIRAPHFVMYVKNLLEQKYGPRLIEQGGLRITTSLDLSIQEKTQDIVQNQVAALASLQVGNGAAMVTNPKTGEILAMVGSKDYFDVENEGNVNVTTSLRQPGSSIKVVNYAAALEHGFTAASIIDDAPVVYRTAGSPPYAPVNYDGRFHGPTPLRYALANSYNIPAVKILEKIGMQTMIDTGRDMGITSWKNEGRYGLSLTLGGGDVTMLELAQVFGTLANEGKHVNLLPILEVTDYTGRLIEKNKPKVTKQALKPETAWIISNILSDNTARIAAFGPNSNLVIPNKTVSVKTGTTDSKRDNWTIGYTPSYVVSVWVGNNDNSPMNPFLTSGVTGAAPIWHDIMQDLLKNTPNEVFPMPATVVSIPCHYGRPEYFVKGTEPAAGRCGALPIATPSAALSQ
jgi:1A family penicillin-binding protein